MKLISIIVPAYNVAEYLPRCLDSILGQTYTNLEVILVDDGSTDDTPSICDEYAKKDNRIKVIHRTNGGLSAARNSGLNIATGDYIGFVDSDDYIDLNMYEIMLNNIERFGASIANCGYHEVGNDTFVRKFSNKITLLDTSEALEVYALEGEGKYISNSVWNKLFSKETVKDIRFVEGRTCEDLVYTGEALVNAIGVVYIEAPLYYYIVDRAGSIMNDNRVADRRLKDMIPLTYEQIELFREKGYERAARMDEYKLVKKELYYYLDFKAWKMKAAAKELYELVKEKEDWLTELYAEDFVSEGDRKRLKLFLKNPNIYNLVSKIYSSVIVPVKETIMK